MKIVSFNPHTEAQHARYRQIRKLLKKSAGGMNAPELEGCMVIARSTLNGCLTFLVEQKAVTRSKTGRAPWRYVWNDEFDLSSIPVVKRPPPHNKGKKTAYVPDTRPFYIPAHHPITAALFGMTR